MEFTTLQKFNTEGMLSHQCIVFASKDRIKELLEPYNYPYNPGNDYEVGYEETIAILVDNDIQVEVVVGFYSDPMNGTTADLDNAMFEGRPLIKTHTLGDLVDDGRESLDDRKDEDEE